MTEPRQSPPPFASNRRLMLLAALAGLAALTAALATGAWRGGAASLPEIPQTAPSGLPVRLMEVRAEAQPGAGGEEAVARFRFLAPQVAAAAPGEGDLQALCETAALPWIAAVAAGAEPGPEVAGLPPVRADVVIVSVEDRAVPFGTPDPEAAQYFEAFRPEGARCLPEGL